MKNEIGKVIRLFLSKKEEPKRQNKAKIYLDEKGVIDDKFYDKGVERSVLLSSTHSYTLASEHQILMEYGTLGENILIDYNLYSLTMGTVLQIGEVKVEITQNCTICNHLSSVDKALPKLLRKDRGIFVKVIQSGVIKEEDKVYLLG